MTRFRWLGIQLWFPCLPTRELGSGLPTLGRPGYRWLVLDFEKEVWNFCCLTASWRWETTPSWGKSMKELECRETCETKQWDVRHWIHDPSCKTRLTLQVIYYSSTSSGRAHCKPLAFSEIKQIPPAPACKVKGLCDARISLGRFSRVFGNLTYITYYRSTMIYPF